MFSYFFPTTQKEPVKTPEPVKPNSRELRNKDCNLMEEKSILARRLFKLIQPPIYSSYIQLYSEINLIELKNILNEQGDHKLDDKIDEFRNRLKQIELEQTDIQEQLDDLRMEELAKL